MALGLVGFAGAAVFSIGALIFAAQSVLRRIRKVADSASAISAGDLTVRVNDLATDELGTLARAFDRMADTLVEDMAERQKVEHELAHRARHDVLTGLPNRFSFHDALKDAWPTPHQAAWRSCSAISTSSRPSTTISAFGGRPALARGHGATPPSRPRSPRPGPLRWRRVRGGRSTADRSR
ncbi:MAG: HAMP domain-containing protein [Ilumatobacteraceae bacterium]